MFKKIKKQNGETFAKTLRNYHNGIFEIPNICSIVRHAGNTAEDAENILQYLLSLLNPEETVQEEVQNPFELLSQAGYDSFFADTLEKQNSIRKYFRSGEELCTFNDSSRFQNYYIINAVKKNVNEINRNDFNGIEKREDEYGTSVISIQVARRGGFISIKNRYNHTVSNCDNTFSSNPDNIVKGLSAAIQKHFNVSFSIKNSVLPDNYTLVNNQILKHHFEFEAILFGDKAYVQNGELIELLPENNEYLFDTFVFDSKTKLFKNVLKNTTDSFVEVFNNAYGGKKSVYVKNHCIYDGDILLVGV